jgi:hypothetical protein
MVRANGANTNVEIHAALSFHPPARRSRFNAPSAARKAERLPAGPGPAEARGRPWAALRASPARIPDRAAALRSHVARAPTDRSRIPANPEGARASHTVRQRSAPPRTTRKDC